MKLTSINNKSTSQNLKYNVITNHNNYCYLIATEDILHGEEIIDLKTLPICSKNSKYNITKSQKEYFETSKSLIAFLNHSCDPNLYINPLNWKIYAKHNIQTGDELTYNYLQTEFIMTNSFDCHCNQSFCFGYIEGFYYLSENDKQRLIQEYLLPHYFLLHL